MNYRRWRGERGGGLEMEIWEMMENIRWRVEDEGGTGD